MSSTRESDSAFVDDFHSKAIEGDNESELPQASKSAASQCKPSSVEESETDRSRSYIISSTGITFREQLKKLEKDIEQKNKKISRLEGELTQLKQKSEDEEKEYQSKVADMERKMNQIKRSCEEELIEKERELVQTRNEAQASELKNLKEKEKLREDLDKLKQEYEKTIKHLEDQNKIEVLELTCRHLEESNKLNLKIKEQNTELERRLREVAEERQRVAELKAEIAKEREMTARKELEEFRRRADKVSGGAEVGEVHIPMTSSSSTSVSSSSSYSGMVPSSDMPANDPDA